MSCLHIHIGSQCMHARLTEFKISHCIRNVTSWASCSVKILISIPRPLVFIVCIEKGKALYEPCHEKNDFCICKNKGTDQLRCTHAADQRLCFRFIDRTTDRPKQTVRTTIRLLLFAITSRYLYRLVYGIISFFLIFRVI